MTDPCYEAAQLVPLQQALLHTAVHRARLLNLATRQQEHTRAVPKRVGGEGGLLGGGGGAHMRSGELRAQPAEVALAGRGHLTQ